MHANCYNLHAADADRIEIHTVAAWEAPQHVAAPTTPNAPVEKKMDKTLIAKTVPVSSGLDTGPTVSAMVQSLARALPTSSRVVQPSSQPSRPARPPTPSPQRVTPAAVEPAAPPTQAVRDAPPPLPSPQQPASAARPTETWTDAASAVPPPEQQVLPLPTLVARGAQPPQSPSQQLRPLLQRVHHSVIQTPQPPCSRPNLWIIITLVLLH